MTSYIRLLPDVSFQNFEFAGVIIMDKASMISAIQELYENSQAPLPKGLPRVLSDAEAEKILKILEKAIEEELLCQIGSD